MAAELRAVGIDLSFAPCVDVDHGVSRVIGDRALHADAAAVAELGIAYMLGMREAGMAATGKHFPGHGAVAADSHVALPIDRREWPDLEADLQPYRRLIANGLPAVMVAHVVFPAMDEHPASLSRAWIDGVLRGDLGFQGAVFADDLSMAGAAAFGDIVARARARARGGLRRAARSATTARRSRRCSTRCAVAPDPVSRMRLVRLHGREADDAAAGRASALAGRRRGRARAHRTAGAPARRRCSLAKAP